MKVDLYQVWGRARPGTTTPHHRKRTRMVTHQDHQVRTKGPLDDLNDKQVGRYLHATKGWRSVSIKRSIASVTTDLMKRGARGVFGIKNIRDQLKEAQFS